MARAPIRIIPQGEIAGGSKEPPAFRLAQADSLFADRAARFDVLAARTGVAAGDGAFLQFMAHLARAQHEALARHPSPAPLLAEHVERCRQHGLPPLGTDAPLDGAWNDSLKFITQAVQPVAPAPVRKVADTLLAQPAAALDTQAQSLLALDYPALDPASAPLLGAALQVHWVKRVTALGDGVIRKLDVPTVCPACGSPPEIGRAHV